eukprot:CAMPEP_0194278084 /NCGR_PEP_ID=MMETSP0169-20130528/10224_1 /TAXON_ID=218684 /ORGANISM="Corethron pennatum, Strain L29A3" /LENGTH=1400 /DNA_ID=CAMNT_0039022199 /DNA_START=51 /DNA_END=4253 /DNA_ORIENTATION=+
MSSSKKRSRDMLELSESSNEVIDLIDSDSEDGSKAGVSRGNTSNFVDLVDSEGFPRYNPGDFGKASNIELDSDSDIELVEAPEDGGHNFETEVSPAGEDEIEVVGAKNVQPTMPHLRQDCPKHTFIPNKKKLSDECRINYTSCDRCYCFLCDEKRSDCYDWKRHCCACNNDENETFWKSVRQVMKKMTNCSETGKVRIRSSMNNLLDKFQKGKGSSKKMKTIKKKASRSSAASLAGVQSHLENRGAFQYLSNLSSTSSNIGSSHNIYSPSSKARAAHVNNRKLGKGPFPPSSNVDRRDSKLVKCRWCKWYSLRTDIVLRTDGSANKETIPTCNDLCHYCGRVPTEKDFNKNQGPSNVPGAPLMFTFFGEKDIPFRIHSHEPQNFRRWKKNWQKEKWKSWNLNNMNHETWQHRVGPHPKLQTILQLIPVTNEASIPKEGFFDNNAPVASDYRNVSAEETSAILISNFHHRTLLHALHSEAVYENQSYCITSSSWNKEERKGVLKVRLYLVPSSFNQDLSLKSTKFSSIIAAWFEMGPFRLDELNAGWKAQKQNVNNVHCSEPEEIYLPCAPWILKNNALRNAKKSAQENEENAVTEFNLSIEASSKSSFSSSLGHSMAGGISNSNNSLKCVLLSYFKEFIIQYYNQRYSDQNENVWVSRLYGISTNHKIPQMKLPFTARGQVLKKFLPLYGLVRDKDLPLLESCSSNSEKLNILLKSTNGMLSHLENIGHEPVSEVDGLNVNLLEYQKHTVGWAIERENLDGGLDTLLWARVPTNQGFIYYSPILNTFMKEKPLQVRGGMICSEMGLGKTIICLSLILKNPAPNSPISGGKVSATKNETARGWSVEPDYSATEDLDRDTYFSRGTLVVCHVSLVGQWVAEAKSKLQNPGLVHSYYGQSRQKDPRLLSMNSIVVTTYQTLASDIFTMAPKNGKVQAPIEQVRWWRIICDESHSIKSNSRNFQACVRLSGEIKWAVTGTPVGTNISDLENQLKFIGISSVEKYFASFSSKKRIGSCTLTNMSGLLFLLRNTMIRHSIQQKERASGLNLIAIPDITEECVEIPFSKEERSEYDELEKHARVFYLSVRNSSVMQRKILEILQSLIPCRIACAGGQPNTAVHMHKDHEKGNNNGKQQAPYQMNEDDSVECPLCLDVLVSPTCTPCKHIFCRACITEVLCQEEVPCPMCREPLNAKMLRRVLLPNQLDHQPSKLPNAKCFFRAKLDFVIGELLHIQQNEPAVKSLIFSQFKSSLSALEKMLIENAIEFCSLSGSMAMNARSKALSDFENNANKKVFLLTLRAGATGINLTSASRVFILDPSLNPALAQQAIGRVHRLGQRNRVVVKHLIIENSIESRLRKMLEVKYDSASDALSPIKKSLTSHVVKETYNGKKEEFDLIFGMNNMDI